MSGAELQPANRRLWLPWLVLANAIRTAMAVDCGAYRAVVGSRYANSCAECPSSFGPYFCIADCKWCDDGSPAEYVDYDERCKPVSEPCAPLPPSPPSPPPRTIGDAATGGCVLAGGTGHTGNSCTGARVFEAGVAKWHMSEEWCNVACQRDPDCSVAEYTPGMLSFGMVMPV